MKLIIFGASGATGRQLLQQALDTGHNVTAFVRNPASLSSFAQKNLRIVQGDVMEEKSVEEGVKEQDAVLIALGVKPGETRPIESTGTMNIIASMNKYHVKRVICESGIGVGDTFSEAPLIKKLFILTILKYSYADKAIQEAYLNKSNLDWTIIHAATLTNGPFTNTIRSAEHLRLSPFASISRADVAYFMLSCLENKKYLQKNVTISS